LLQGRTEVGVLTEAAMRLGDEIVSSRHARVALRGDFASAITRFG
jgi:hypothetical protein